MTLLVTGNYSLLPTYAYLLKKRIYVVNPKNLVTGCTECEDLTIGA